MYTPELNIKISEFVNTNYHYIVSITAVIVSFVAFENLKPIELSFNEMKTVILDCLTYNYKNRDEIFETFNRKISDLEIENKVKYKRYEFSETWALSRGSLVYRVLKMLADEGLVESISYGEPNEIGARAKKWRKKMSGQPINNDLPNFDRGIQFA